MDGPKPMAPPVSWPIPSMASGRPFALAETIRRWTAGRHRGGGQSGLADLFFSLKTLIAALLAYYIALTAQLERPYWAVITCYIVAQPLTGALLSKGLFRLVGTLIGAGVAIALVPQLVDAPELLVGALALWLGACSYVAALDRTPRAYLSLLAGYSAIIVAVPTVDDTQTIFEVAVARVQEIGIGILCVSLVHAVLFPSPVWHRVRGRLGAILADAGAWAGDALAVPPRPEGVVWQARRKLFGDLHDLHQLSTHLPYDMTSPAIVPARLREAEMQLGLHLPLASAVEDRIQALEQAGGVGLDLAALIADVRGWVQQGTARGQEELTARARALEPEAEQAWPDLLRLSLLDRLVGLIAAHASACALRDHLLDGAAALGVAEPVSRRALHRDHRVALRAAATTVLAVVGTCALWIATAWPEGGGAVVTGAIICALFSHLDAPMRAARHVYIGSLGAVVTAGFFAFVLAPRVSNFEMLALLLVPFLLVQGWLMARPERVPFGVGAVLSFPGLAGLDVSYESHFEAFANQAVAQLVGSFLACLVLGIVRTTGAATSARRLARAGWRELARKTRAMPDTTGWISRMLDRMVLLGPHLSALGNGDALAGDRLRDIRIGMALDDLQRVGQDAAGPQARQINALNARLRAHFLAAQKSGLLDADPALCRAIERALTRAGRLPPSPARRSLLLALVGLSRNLCL
jgi:uncharacterized membrane protein YccC